MTNMRIVHTGAMRVETRMTETGATVMMDGPAAYGGLGEALSPTDMLAAALGSCILGALTFYSEKLGIQTQGATADVCKEMTATGVRRLASVSVSITLPCAVPEERLADLMKAVDSCPVKNSLNPDIQVTVSFR